MSVIVQLLNPIFKNVFNPGIQDVYLNDNQLTPTQQTSAEGLDEVVFNVVESFEPPLGEITMSSGQQNIPNRSGKYTHDYSVTMAAEGYKPQVTITPPTGSVLEYEVGDSTPTVDPLVWNVRVSIKSPPGEEVTEEPSVGFVAVPVGVPENPYAGNFALGPVVQSGYGTDINYTLKQPANIQAAVYDMSGRQIEVLSDGKQPSGKNKLHWDSNDDPTAAYIIRIQAEGQKPHAIKVINR